MIKNTILKLHQQISNNQSWLEKVWQHSNIVKDLSLQIADELEEKGIKVDRELLEVGALVHDIGTHLCFDKDQNLINPYIQHGILGEAVLLRNGFPEKIARFASHHTGVGITKVDIQKQNLPLPLKDYIPETIEEEIICYSDKFHSKSSNFHTFEEIVKDLSRFGEEKTKKLLEFKEKFGIPALN